ncbi:lectin-like domain-containing protein [Candidatus Rhodoluna planktonica]|uniref:lectin-like domain-containing protein n=1 Tax=Candidatus Rhodoluna planktonica TaxID=535712 RepID=UPI000A5AC67D|nr:putative Ig domain-containing protein [Candidatus Rhodoluna planktonica]
MRSLSKFKSTKFVSVVAAAAALLILQSSVGLAPAAALPTFSPTDFTTIATGGQSSTLTPSTANSYLTYELTPATNGRAGAVWNQKRVVVSNDFEINAEVYLGSQDSGADGMAFVLQPNSTSNLSQGGGLGYQGITPSLAVELDTYPNTSDSNDSSTDYMSFTVNGDTDHSSLVNQGFSQVAVGNLEDGTWRSFRFTYNATSKIAKAYLAGVEKLSTQIDLSTLFSASSGNVYWGFTAATGGMNNQQQVRFADTAIYAAVTRTNQGPTVSDPGNKSINLNATKIVAFDIADQDNSTTQAQWKIEATSSDPSKVNVKAASITSVSTASVELETFATAGSATISVKVFDSDGAVAERTFTASASNAPSSISPANLGAFEVNTQIVPIQLTSDAPGTLTWSVQAGTLPAGLTLSNSGALSGTPSVAGAYDFTVRVTNSNNEYFDKQFTGVVSQYLVLTNGAMRFGNGSQSSIDGKGNFQQPFYWSAASNQFFKLTYSSYPLDMAIGSGTQSQHWSGGTVQDFSGLSPSSKMIDYSGFVVTGDQGSGKKGYGKIVTRFTYGINAQSMQIENTYSLGQSDSFVKIQTKITNLDANPVSQAYIYVGTRDDWVGNSDGPTKTKGNLDGPNGSFQATTVQSDPAKALRITTASEGALFYSTTDGTNMSIDSCCSFANAYNVNPAQSPLTLSGDGSYVAVFPVGNISANGSSTVTWFYAAGSLQSLDSVAQSVAAAAAPPAPNVTRASSQATLTWQAPEIDPASEITNYAYSISEDNGATWSNAIAVSPASINTTFVVTGLDNTKRYQFRVAAYTRAIGSQSTATLGSWSGASSAELLGGPNVPTISSIVGGNGSLSINFTAATSPISPVTNYEYSLDGGTTWVTPSTPVTVSPLLVTGLTNGSSYAVKVRAVNIYGAGNATAAVSALNLPRWTSTTIPTLVVGGAISQTVAAIAEVTYSLTDPVNNPLPAGLTLNSATGRISGTPTTPGVFDFSISATNSAGTVTQRFQGEVSPFSFVPGTANYSATTGVAFNAEIKTDTARGFNVANGVTVVSVGNLPSGISFTVIDDNVADTYPRILLTGTPMATGTSEISIELRDSNNRSISATINLVVSNPPPPAPVVTPTPTPSPSASVRPTPRPTPSPTQSTVAPRPTATPTATPSPTPTATPSPSAQPVAAPVLQPTVEPTPNVVYQAVSEIPQVLINALLSPIAFTTNDAAEPVLPELAPLESAALVNGTPVPVQLIPTETADGYVLKGEGFEVVLAATSKSGEPLKLDESGNIILNDERVAKFSGSGFAPGSIIKVWLFSEPTELREVIADANGEFSGEAAVPADAPMGEHTIQLNGITQNGELRSVAMGVVLNPDAAAQPVSPTTGSGEINWWLLSAGFAAAALLLVLVTRRRKKA